MKKYILNSPRLFWWFISLMKQSRFVKEKQLLELQNQVNSANFHQKFNWITHCIDEIKLMKTLAKNLNLEYKETEQILSIAKPKYEWFESNFIFHYQGMVFETEEHYLFVMSNLDIKFYEQCLFFLADKLTDKKHQVILTNGSKLKSHLKEWYGIEQNILLQKNKPNSNYLSADFIKEIFDSSVEKQNIEQIYEWILHYCIKSNISDIHFEPINRKESLIRFRKEGLLNELKVIDQQTHQAILSRFKLLASLKVGEKRSIQEGKVSFELEKVEYDFRVSFIPTLNGEKLALRYFDKNKIQGDFSTLGFLDFQIEQLYQALKANKGLFLFTGATGSGKTTSLYNLMLYLSNKNLNIHSIEDPIEMNLPRINQMEVKTQLAIDFAMSLKALLRQDPDVIMIGEIRDYETAKIAIQASLTGHIVISTIHTNNTVETILRLIDLGVEPYLIKSSLSLIVSQQLVSLTCQKCQGQGCKYCYYTKVKNRIGMFEVLSMDEQVCGFIHNDFSVSDLTTHLKQNNFAFMAKVQELLSKQYPIWRR